MVTNVSSPVTDPLPGQDNTIGSAGYATDVTPAWGTGLPAWCDALIALLSSGQLWPETSESGEAALAVAYEDWSRAALEFAVAGGTARDLILQGWDGPAADAFRQRAEQMLAEGQGISALAALAHQYALQHDSLARDTQYAKLVINVGFWITVTSIAIAAAAAALSAGALAPFIGPYAARLRSFLDKVFAWLERAAGVRYAGAAGARAVPRLAALGAGQGAKGLLARAVSSHMLRELPEELGEGLLGDYLAQSEQLARGTRTRWDGQSTAATLLGDGMGAILASKMTRPVGGLVDRLPGIRTLNAAAGDAPGALNALMRFPGRATQTALTNMAVSAPAGMVSNGIVYGKWEAPSLESLLGSAAAGVGRTNTISPFSVDVMSAVANPRRALDTASATALSSDTTRATPPPPPSPPTPPPDGYTSQSAPTPSSPAETSTPPRSTPHRTSEAAHPRSPVPPRAQEQARVEERGEAHARTQGSGPAQDSGRAQGSGSAQESARTQEPARAQDPVRGEDRGRAEGSGQAQPRAQEHGRVEQQPSAQEQPQRAAASQSSRAAALPGDVRPVAASDDLATPDPRSPATTAATTSRPGPVASSSTPAPGDTAVAGQAAPGPVPGSAVGPTTGQGTGSGAAARPGEGRERGPAVPDVRRLSELLSGRPVSAAGSAEVVQEYRYVKSGPDSWKLTDEDNELIFRRDIVPALMAGVRRPEHPRVVFVGGQPESGMTTARQAAMEAMRSDGALVADFDGLLRYAPKYAELMARNDRIAAAQVGGDAYVWMKKVIALAGELRVNLIREGAMNSSPGVEAEAAEFRRLGYRTEAYVMAVPAALSRLSALDRYQRMRDTDGYGRLVAQEIHDTAFDGIPGTMRAIDDARYLDAVTIYRRGGEAVYRNELDELRRWRRTPRAREVLEEVRGRPFTEEEARWFRETYERLSTRLPDELKDQLPEIADLGAEHGVDVDPQGRAERLRERYTTEADGVLRDEHAAEREQLAAQHRRSLAGAAPHEREGLREEQADEWDGLVRRQELGRAGLRVLAYCTEWDPHRGGIIAVNRNLAEGLARAGHEVYVRVGHEVPPGVGGERLHVIGPRRPEPGRSEMDQLSFDGEELPPEVDVVIGHSRYSGPAAMQARDRLYPDAPLVHVLHMVTGALGRIADRPALGRDFENIERAVISEADMLVGVGPVLSGEARRLADSNPGDREPPVHELMPGVPFEAPRQRPFFGERTRTVLLIGRADAAQKGGHEAALMIRELQKDLDVRLVIRGAAPETVEEVKERLSDVAGREVEVRPFTLDREEMLADIRAADVVIMPSRGEGFGLAALEAAGAGAPILIPRSSGLGGMLGDPSRFPAALTRASLVEQGFEDEVPVQRWAAHLKEMLRDLPRAQEQARQLQRLLREANATWEGAAESLVAAVRELDRSAPAMRAPVLPPMSGDGWVNCAQGHAHWGRFGGAGLLVHHRGPDGVHVLMQRRGEDTHLGGTWALPGGARDSDESPAGAALRETAEESDLAQDAVQVEHVIRDDHGGWAYDTVIAVAAERVQVRGRGEETLELAWVPIEEVARLNLHPGFAASWPRLRAVLEGAPPPGPAEATPYPEAGLLGFGAAPVVPLPAHPVTGAAVAAREPLPHGDGLLNRELVTFADGTRVTYERFERPGDAAVRVLDAHVGRAVGARVPLSYALGLRDVYTDHMPGEPAPADLRERAATRDGVFLGLYHAVTAKHGFGHGDLVLGPSGGLIPTGDGTASHLQIPDAANPFVQAFFRETEPRAFRWAANPLTPSDVSIIRRGLDALRPLFERLNRLPLYEGVIQRFEQAAEQARGTVNLLPSPAGHPVTLPGQETQAHYPAPPPPDSAEAAHHRRVAEELMTADGTFTDTSEAKTYVIDALAERMRSTTPQLVMAATGLHVGSDMINRLGDPDHVLVPFNERYPSMGAEVRHADELDSRNTPAAALRMDSPEAERLVRRIAVSELLHAWAHRNANSNVRVLAIQEVVQEEFGLTRAMSWPMDGRTRAAVDMELLYNRRTLRDFVRTQYDFTQEVLAARGIEEVIAYRGMAWSEGRHSVWDALRPGDMIEMRHRPLASWSADRQVVMDWLDTLDGRGVLLVDRKPARDILSLPVTGMGYFVQREFVALPGDRLTTLGHITPGRPAPPQDDPPIVTRQDAPAGSWRPTPVTAGALDLADPLDRRIARVLDGTDPAPPWWPRDDSGYAVAKRDLDFLGIAPRQLAWLLRRAAPLGMTPRQYDRYATELLEALGRDGIDPSQVDIRLRGTGAVLFAGRHKTFPAEDQLTPQARERLREWFGDDPVRPKRRLFDAMYRLGLEAEPSDYDMDLSSSAMVRRARVGWTPGRFPGDFMGGHGYIDKRTLMEAFPWLVTWKDDWEAALGRPISLGLFESSGPFDGHSMGLELSSHHQDSDWVIHRPDRPLAWRQPIDDERGE
ncbi:zeta toxin family protein [Nonomuraea sp. NPDC049419]|uniref:zeta toxin family protein n=1 Tax=Nonomuraea sp. NPDC049419 TaxID=3155772 RepID=UPI00342A57C3